MRRLAGEDSGFLSLESPIQPMHAMWVVLLKPGSGPDGRPQPLDLALLRRHVDQRLHECPAFRWRFVPVPLGLSHGVFIEDPAFNLDAHLDEQTLSAPGGAAELDRFVASCAERPLDRRIPLWRLSLVHGLADGRQAVVVRVHHCLMDGYATLSAFDRLFPADTSEASPGRNAGDPPGWRPDRLPSRARLLIAGVGHQARAFGALPGLVTRTRRGLRAAKAARAASGTPPPRPYDAPPSLFNQALTSERVFGRTEFRLADLKLVKDAAGTTVNDVALAVVSGALRSYLLRRDALPKRALTANVPVGLEPPGAPRRTHGNRFSALITTLATDEADAWQRLLAISSTTREAKRLLSLGGDDLLPDWLEQLPPAILDRGVRHARRVRMRDPGRVETSVVVSNVRGPQRPRSLASATVEEMWITGPPNNGVGLNIVVVDYGERVSLSVVAFADCLVEPAELMADVAESLAELIQQATIRV